MKHPEKTGLRMLLLPQRFAIHRFPPDTEFNFDLLRSAAWCSITRTNEELSIVLPQEIDPGPGKHEPGWSCLRVAGTLDFTQIGVIAGLSRVLADAGISIFAVSTYDTDYIFVKSADIDCAIRALLNVGHEVVDEGNTIDPRPPN